MIGPDFFIIGEPKCGTTIINDYLSVHKDLFMAKFKELNYFNFDHLKEADNFHGKNKSKLLYRHRNFTEYLSIFEDGKKYKFRGESSVIYAYSKVASEKIFNFNKESKIIYCLREPLSLLISLHGQFYKFSDEDCNDFLKCLNLEEKRKKGLNLPNNCRFPSFFYYSEWVKFSEHLQRYLDYFPKEQIKVIIHEEFKKDNQKTIDEITDFLGVERIKIEEKQLNVRAISKYPKIRKFLNRSSVSLFIRRLFSRKIQAIIGKFLNSLIPLVSEKPLTLPETEKIRLMRQYKLEVVKINDLLHKNDLIDKEMDLVKYWGYDKI